MKPTLKEVLEIVAQFAEQTYPGFEYATIKVQVRADLPEAVLVVNRLRLHLSGDASPELS